MSVMLMILTGSINYRAMQQLTETGNWITHTHEVITSLDGVVSQLKDTETGQRGYLLTHDLTYWLHTRRVNRNYPSY